MALANRRQVSAILICSIFLLQLVLISDVLKPVSGSKKRILIKIKKIGALLWLLKKKKPRIGILPLPLPLPIPLKIEKPGHPVVVKQHYAHAEPHYGGGYGHAEPHYGGYGGHGGGAYGEPWAW